MAASNTYRRVLGRQLRSLLAVTMAYGAAGAASAVTPYAMINAEAARSSIAVKPVRGNLSMLEGSGGNITALSGPDGILLVDAGIAVSEAKIQNALHGIEPAKIKYLVNTHWHWDHSDGNGWVRKSGATIIAQKNTAKHLAQTIRVVEWGHTFPPVPKASQPTVIVDQSRDLNFDGETVRLRAYVPSHTDGDLSVYFPKADVLATGDTWWNGLYPFIDYVAGGSIDGMIKASNANLAMSTPHTLIVPGHGEVGNKTQLAAFRDMLVAVRGNVAALKRQGKTLEQTIAAKPTAKFDAQYGQGVIDPALFISLVYRGV